MHGENLKLIKWASSFWSFMVLFGKNMEPINRLPALASLLFGMLFLYSEAWNFISESNFPSVASSPPLSPLLLRYTKGHCFAPWFTVFADKSDIKMYVSTEHMWNDYSYREKSKYSERNLSQCQFVHRKCRGIEPGTSRWEAGDSPPEPWHGLHVCVLWVPASQRTQPWY